MLKTSAKVKISELGIMREAIVQHACGHKQVYVYVSPRYRTDQVEPSPSAHCDACSHS